MKNYQNHIKSEKIHQKEHERKQTSYRKRESSKKDPRERKGGKQMLKHSYNLSLQKEN